MCIKLSILVIMMVAGFISVHLLAWEKQKTNERWFELEKKENDKNEWARNYTENSRTIP